MNKNKPTAQLKEWHISHHLNRVFGKAYVHWRFNDGTDVITSQIEHITRCKDGVMIETRNTNYKCRYEDEKPMLEEII